jgi:hypothetical protein
LEKGRENKNDGGKEGFAQQDKSEQKTNDKLQLKVADNIYKKPKQESIKNKNVELRLKSSAIELSDVKTEKKKLPDNFLDQLAQSKSDISSLDLELSSRSSSQIPNISTIKSFTLIIY